MNEEVKTDTPEQEEFRAHCREWLSKNQPAPFAGQMVTNDHLKSNTPEYHRWLQDWQKSAYDGGLVGCDYPKEYGGGGHTDCQRIANQEMVRAKTPILIGKQGLALVSPTLLDHGSEFLKKRFIPKALSGEEMWCQGFSEPNAGSDVANQETFAERKGDHWVINGQKVWTSYWHYTDWMILLARTDRSHKHNGLTYFCVPIESELGKSIELRPLINITGGAHFAEEFFKDLTVHNKYVIDAVGKGWSVALTTLKHERGQGQFVEPVAEAHSAATKVETEADRSGKVHSPLIELAKTSVRNGKPAKDDPVIRDRIMQQIIQEKGFDEGNRRSTVKGLVDHPMRIPMQFKLVNSEISQNQAALALDIEGISANLRNSENESLSGGSWGNAYVGSFSITIAAGTSEILRNQLGERVLGLPKTK